MLANRAHAAVTSLPLMAEHLAQWVHQYDLKNARTNLVLDSSRTRLLLTEAPEVAEAELVQAMHWQLKENPEIDIENAIMDCFSIPGQRDRGRQPMAYVVSARKEELRPLVELCSRVGLDLRSIDIAAMTQRNIASLLAEDELGIAMLTFSETQGLLSLSRNGDLFLARDIDVGIRDLLPGNAQPSNEQGLQLASDVVADSRDHLLEMIVLEIQRSMDYYERYFAQPPIQTLALAPLPQEVTDLSEYIASQLGMKVREIDLNRFVLGSKSATADAPINLPLSEQHEYLNAIGAVMRYQFEMRA